MAGASGKRIGKKASAWAVLILTVLYLSLAATPYGAEVDYWVGVALLIAVVFLSVLALRNWWAAQQENFGGNGNVQSGLMYRLRRWMYDQGLNGREHH